MSGYCIVENDVIVNIVEASSEYAASQGWIANQGWGIGWVSNGGGGFVAPEPSATAFVARTCTPAQGLVALFAVKGITEDDVHAGIASIPDPVERYTAQIGFKRATVWEEDSPTMQLVQALLALSAQGMRELFDYAQSVRV
jgi:hypothetical protein